MSDDSEDSPRDILNQLGIDPPKNLNWVSEKRTHKCPCSDPECFYCGGECTQTVEPFGTEFDGEMRWLRNPPERLCADCAGSKKHHRRLRRQRADQFTEKLDDAGVADADMTTARRSDVTLLKRFGWLVELNPNKLTGDEQRGAYIWGPTESGKTTQAVKAMGLYLGHWVKKKGQPVDVQYLNIARYIHKVRESWNSNSDMKVTLEDYTDADFLVVDDLGTEVTDDYASQKIYNLLEVRNGKAAVTVYVSNFPLPTDADDNVKDLSDVGHYGKRELRRIRAVVGDARERLKKRWWKQ